MNNHDTSLQPETEPEIQERGVWGPWATAGWGIVIGLAILAAQLISGIVYAIVKAITSQPTDIYEFVDSLTTDGLLLSIAGIISSIIGIALIAIIIKTRRRYSIKEYLGFSPPSKKLILVLFVISGLFTLISQGLSSIPERSDSMFIEFMFMVYYSSVWPVLFWLNIAVFIPALEEVFFRGFIFAGFRQSRIGITGTIIITSLLWTLFHLGQYDFIDLTSLFVFGIILGIIRQKTNSMWGPFILHAINNFIAMIYIATAANSFIS